LICSIAPRYSSSAFRSRSSRKVEEGQCVGRVLPARRPHLRQRDGAQLGPGGAVAVLRAHQIGEARVARIAQAHVTRVRVGIGSTEHLAVRVRRVALLAVGRRGAAGWAMALVATSAATTTTTARWSGAAWSVIRVRVS